MDLSQLMLSRIDLMLESVGPGMKVLLMDSETTTSVSLSCPQSQIMKKEVFLFEYLHAPSSTKSSQNNRLSFLKCVVLIRPSTENMMLLTKELSAPRYGSYFVYFTNRVKRSDLKHLAESDCHELVADIKEIPSDFFALEPHVFLVSGAASPIRNLVWNSDQSRQAFHRCFDGLKSLLLGLKISKPQFSFMKSSSLCEELAATLHKEFSGEEESEFVGHSGRNESGLVVIVDRRLDLVTPILNQWTYQAMIHELIGMKNNAVDLSGRSEVPDDLRQITMSSSSDEFYRQNMYANFGEIGQTVKTLVQHFQEKAKSHQNIDSIGDIKEFVANYPEFKKMSGTVSKHVAVLGELSREVKDHALLDVSECEQTLVCGMDKDNSLPKLKQVLALPNIRSKDALRLVALFTIRYSKEVEKNLDQICGSVRGVSKKEVYDFIQQIIKFSRVRSSSLFEDKSNPFISSFKLRGTDNVYTQHRPFITKDVLPDLLKGKQRPELEFLSRGVPNELAGHRRIIVFIIGGITYEETRAVHLLNKELGTNVVIGGTSILNFDLFTEELKQACSA